jgi:hypothetical protein
MTHEALLVSIQFKKIQRFTEFMVLKVEYPEIYACIFDKFLDNIWIRLQNQIFKIHCKQFMNYTYINVCIFSFQCLNWEKLESDQQVHFSCWASPIQFDVWFFCSVLFITETKVIWGKQFLHLQEVTSTDLLGSPLAKQFRSLMQVL